MKIATWNINGIKARLNNLIIWLKQNQPDIVCLQETKSSDEQFPYLSIETLGYHVETNGQKGFNGVALLSRMRPYEINRNLPGDISDKQARFIEGVYSTQNGVIRIASLYLPNGNPIRSDKYLYKLSWMRRLHDFAIDRLRLEEPLILAGDYNIIPRRIDAKDPTKWKENALFLPSAREAFQKLVNLGFTDAIRAVSIEAEYTFWQYQAAAWLKNDGIRIDHLLLSPEASDKLMQAFVQKKMRGWGQASDHVPVWVDLDI
ncbi:MAG: exodeoxyribonuclease III [Candidatus Tokpelaia sp. JSC188]|nr:MAG: exodeoxyribonuclease III [Candidatus Tokpelaia sp. JSC188]